MRKEMLYAAPIAGMFVAAPLSIVFRKAGIMAVVETEPITKMRGKDKFKMAVRVKNNSDETVNNLELVGWAEKGAKTLTIIQSTTFSLSPGEEKRIPSSGFKEVSIPSDWEVGTTKACALVTQEDLDIYVQQCKDAWDVTYRMIIINISAPESVYVGQEYDVTIQMEVDEGEYSIIINDMMVDTVTGAGSFSRTYTLTAPSSPGSYVIPVKIKRVYTGEEVTSSFGITVKGKPDIKITKIEVS